MAPYLHLFQLVLPEVIVVLAALAVLSVDLLVMRKRSVRLRFGVASAIGLMGCFAAVARMALAPQQANLLNGVLLANPLTDLVQIVLLFLTVLTLLMAADSEFTDHAGEFVVLILLATVGMMFLAATQDLLVLFLSLELLSLSLYVLAGFNKNSPRSSEAALKYFLFGGMSAAFLLFGFSLLYGLSNSTSFTAIAASIHGVPLNPLLIVAIVTTVVGFGFKIAAFPFHFWAPDVYEAAPAPSAAFIASSSKVASFFLFFEIMTVAFGNVPQWVPVLCLVAALSMVFGNLAALRQTGLRRLLAYSAIAHAGYMLLAIVSHSVESLAAVLFYVMTYALATIGIFTVLGVVERETGSDQIANFDGLSRRSPLLAACLFLFLLSLAGIPPLAGFFGKFYLLIAAIHASAGLLWLAMLVLAMSAVSLYYYLQVLKRVYVTGAADGVGSIKISATSTAVMILLAAAVLLYGCAPQLLLGWILRAIAG